MNGNGKEELNQIKKYGQDFVRGVNNKITVEDDHLEMSAAGVITEKKYPVRRCSAFEFWLGAKEENLAGGQTITFKFYRTLDGADYLGETITVTSPAVTANQAQKVDVEPSAPIESYDKYAVSGTVTIASGGVATAVVGKKSQG